MIAIAAAVALLAHATQEPPVVLSDVVSARPRTFEATRDYVALIAEPPLHAISLATWRRPICIETVNLRPRAVEALVTQITTRAAAVGVEVKTSDCWPNVGVIGTSDGRFTATELVSAYGDAFRASNGATQGSREDLRRFAERDAPVRWWTIAAQYDVENRAFAEPLSPNATPRRLDTTASSIFFNQALVRAMVKVIVILDATRTADVPAEVLGDYVAMVVLAEIDPEADLHAFPTVMNLWREGHGSIGMTAWDQRYLCALYSAGVRQPGGDLPPIRSRYQLNEIARRMAAPPDDRAPEDACS